jgi:uncharacterized peroxidase-related enzyme
LAEHAAHDYRQAELEPRVRSLCDFAVELTHRPAANAGPQVDALRAEGWTDSAIHDAIQVVAFFNYINRIAEGVGIDGEPEWT